MTEARKRRIHEVTFRCEPFWMRVPTFSEEVWAECAAAKYVADNHGADLDIDDDIWRVDLRTAHVLCKAIVFADGGEFMVPRLFLERYTADEQVELLHLLNACREAENPSPRVETDEEVAAMAASLAGLGSVDDAYRACAGMSHEAMVRLAYGMALLADTAPNTEQPLAA